MHKLEKLKVLIVDDTILYRKVLSAAVNSTGIGIATHTASNGKIALDHLKQRSFDVVLLDVVMPDMDGLEVLSVITEFYTEIFVIMISSEGSDSAANTFAALKKGALDFIMKPQEDNAAKNMAILQKTLQALFLAVKVKKTGHSTQRTLKNQSLQEQSMIVTNHVIRNHRALGVVCGKRDIDLIVIAASTGGPEALERILKKLPKSLKQPILIVQHMPKDFTKVLANIMNEKCNLQVTEAQQGDGIIPGQVLIAPGGQHMLVGYDGCKMIVELSSAPYVNGVRPAADLLFRSVAGVYKGKNVLSVMLTGMGHDGTKGVMEMKKECNCYCLAQSEGTCVVYGMPSSVVEAGLADEILDVEDMATRIQKLCQQ